MAGIARQRWRKNHSHDERLSPSTTAHARITSAVGIDANGK
jgi:hypothetical protein